MRIFFLAFHLPIFQKLLSADDTKITRLFKGAEFYKMISWCQWKKCRHTEKLLITAHAAYLVNHWDSSLIRHANFHQANDIEKKVLCNATLDAKTKLF